MTSNGSTGQPRYDDEAGQASDLQLLEAVRSGSVEAFGTLWSRHEAAARVLARRIAAPGEVDDLVSESFLRVLRSLRDGGGPETAFRAYTLSTLRRVNIDNARRDQRVVVTDDTADLDPTSSPSSEEVAVDRSDRRLAWAAWASLPDDVRSLLWLILVDEQTPAQLADSLGTTPNGVASRATRARERLRQAFVTVHLADTSEPACRATRGKLGAYVRSSLAPRDRAGVDDHLERCPRCRAALVAAVDVGQTIRTHVVPLLGAGAIVGAALPLGEAVAGGASTAAPGAAGPAGAVSTTAAPGAVASTTVASTTVAAAPIASSVASIGVWVIGAKAIAVSAAAAAAIVGAVGLNSILQDPATPAVPLSATSSPSREVTSAPRTTSVATSPSVGSREPLNSSGPDAPPTSRPTRDGSTSTRPVATQPSATQPSPTEPSATRSTRSSSVVTTAHPLSSSPRDSFSPPPITSAPTQPPG